MIQMTSAVDVGAFVTLEQWVDTMLIEHRKAEPNEHSIAVAIYEIGKRLPMQGVNLYAYMLKVPAQGRWDGIAEMGDEELLEVRDFFLKNMLAGMVRGHETWPNSLAWVDALTSELRNRRYGLTH